MCQGQSYRFLSGCDILKGIKTRGLNCVTEYFKPTWMVESIYQLKPEQLQKRHIKGVITDLDNTLIAWNEPDASEEMADWLQMMAQAEIPVVIVSNNSKKRVERVAADYGIRYQAMAKKPLRHGMRQALKKLALPKEEVVVVGDQLLTDIFTANRLGLQSVLVKPIVSSDGKVTQFNRRIEQAIFKRVLKRNPELKWGKMID